MIPEASGGVSPPVLAAAVTGGLPHSHSTFLPNAVNHS